MQKLKQGVASRGLTLGNYVARLLKKREKCVVLEIFAGTARLTSMARGLRGRWWHAMSPVDILSGQDMRKREDQQNEGLANDPSRRTRSHHPLYAVRTVVSMDVSMPSG